MPHSYAVLVGLIGFFSGLTLSYLLTKSHRTKFAAEQKSDTKAFSFETSLIEQVPVPVFYKDRDGRYLGVNQAFEEFFGVSRNNLLGKTVFDIAPSELAENYHQKDQELFKKGGSQLYEYLVEKASGAIRNVVFQKNILTNTEGKTMGLIGAVLDITEQKKLEKELRTQEQAFLTLAENFPDIIIRHDRNLCRTYINPAYKKQTGISPDQYLGNSASGDWRGDISFEAFKAEMQEVLDTGRIKDGIIVSWPDHEGKAALRSNTIIPEKDDTGQTHGVFVVSRDITALKQAEIHYKNLLENWPDEIACYDLLCRRTYMNSVMEKTLRQQSGREDSLLGERPTQTFPHLKEIAGYEKQLRLAIENRERRDYIMAWPHDSGHKSYRQVRILPEKDTAGELTGIFTIARDNTAEMQVEIERQASLDFFEKLDRINRVIQQSNDLEKVMADALEVILDIFATDRAFLTFPLDPDAESFTVPYEKTRQEYVGAAAAQKKFPMDDEYRQLIKILQLSDIPVQFGANGNYPLPEETRKEHQVKSMLAIALHPKIGAPWAFGLHQCSSDRTWTATDIKLFNEAGKRLCDALTATLSYRNLKESEHFLDNILEHLPTMLFVKDAKTLQFIRVNKVVEEFLGMPEQEIIGKTDYDFFPPEIADFHAKKDLEALQTQKLVQISEEKLVFKNGHESFTQVKKIAVRDRFNENRFLLVLTEDITKLKHSLEATRKFSQTVEQSPDAVVITDSEGRIEHVNQKLIEIGDFNQEELIGGSVDDLFGDHLFELEQINQAIEEKGVWRTERQRELANGQRICEDIQVTPIVNEEDPAKPITHYVIIQEDITERKNLEGQLQQSQKMEAIGQLAGGVAHDFNNMLGVIIGRSDLALNRLDPEGYIFQSLQEIRKAAQRSADLTRQLLAFARKQDIAPQVLNLNDLIEGTLNMMRRMIGEDIALVWRPESKLGHMSIDPTQLDQVLANLCVNARDAIKGIGKITIETRNVFLDEDYCRVNSDARPGHFILLSVSDNGCGMDSSVLDKIFEPFFTTKELGQGTGLGLSTVYGIVRQNNGFIHVYSEPARGTTFNIYFPEVQNEDVRLNDRPIQLELPTGPESILVVEDDGTILATEKNMLETLGYKVFAAQSPAEALKIVEININSIDLLMTDVIMPEMNGRELVQHISAMSSHLKVIYMSGYTGDMIGHHGVLEEGVNFIQKPFTLAVLAAKVRKVLDQTSGATFQG